MRFLPHAYNNTRIVLFYVLNNVVCGGWSIEAVKCTKKRWNADVAAHDAKSFGFFKLKEAWA